VNSVKPGVAFLFWESLEPFLDDLGQFLNNTGSASTWRLSARRIAFSRAHFDPCRRLLSLYAALVFFSYQSVRAGEVSIDTRSSYLRLVD